MEDRVELSPSGRAACRKCREKIPKGVPRFGRGVANEYDPDSGQSHRWHHVACAARAFPESLLDLLADYRGDVPDEGKVYRALAEQLAERRAAIVVGVVVRVRVGKSAGTHGVVSWEGASDLPPWRRLVILDADGERHSVRESEVEFDGSVRMSPAMSKAKSTKKKATSAKKAKSTKKKAKAKASAKKRSSKPRPIAKRFAARTVVFTGTLDSWSNVEGIAKAIRDEGGTVAAKVTAQCSVLVVGKTRGSGPSAAERRAVALNEKGATIRIVDQEGLLAMFRPTDEEAATLLRMKTKRRWQRLIRPGDLYFTGELPTCDLRGADLRGIDVTGVRVGLLRLDGADLTGIQGTTLANFGDVHNARFDGARMPHAHFEDVSGSRFRKATLQKSSFWVVAGADFQGADIRQSNFRRATGDDAVFVNANLQETSFEEVVLGNANFSGADLWNARMRGAQLTRANFRDATLVGADLTGAVLTQADLTGADLTGAVVEGATFEGAILEGTVLDGVRTETAKGLVP